MKSGDVQNAMSLKTGGYLENVLNLVSMLPLLNWSRKRLSFDQNSLHALVFVTSAQSFDLFDQQLCLTVDEAATLHQLQSGGTGAHRMSGISNKTIARRSRPSPNAHDTLPLLPLSSRMTCCVTPQPSTSNQSSLK